MVILSNPGRFSFNFFLGYQTDPTTKILSDLAHIGLGGEREAMDTSMNILKPRHLFATHCDV